jgi:hypothetical protein
VADKDEPKYYAEPGPLTYDYMKRYLTTTPVISGASLSFSMSTVASPQDAFVEVKVWYPNGRIEAVRGMCSGVVINDKSGRRVNVEAGPVAKVEEGFTFSVNGTTKAWKRGPDARPSRERKPRS